MIFYAKVASRLGGEQAPDYSLSAGYACHQDMKVELNTPGRERHSIASICTSAAKSSCKIGVFRSATWINECSG